MIESLTPDQKGKVLKFITTFTSDDVVAGEESNVLELTEQLGEAKERIVELEEKLARAGGVEGVEYEDWTVDELKEEARKREIAGANGMNKKELVKALKKSD